MRIVHSIFRLLAILLGIASLFFGVIFFISVAIEKKGDLSDFSTQVINFFDNKVNIPFVRDFLNNNNTFHWVVGSFLLASGIFTFFVAISNNKIFNIIFIALGVPSIFLTSWWYGLPYFIIGTILLFTPSGKKIV